MTPVAVVENPDGTVSTTYAGCGCCGGGPAECPGCGLLRPCYDAEWVGLPPGDYPDPNSNGLVRLGLVFEGGDGRWAGRPYYLDDGQPPPCSGRVAVLSCAFPGGGCNATFNVSSQTFGLSPAGTPPPPGPASVYWRRSDAVGAQGNIPLADLPAVGQTRCYQVPWSRVSANYRFDGDECRPSDLYGPGGSQILLQEQGTFGLCLTAVEPCPPRGNPPWWGRLATAARATAATAATADPPDCRHRGPDLTGPQREAAGLGHGRRWALCLSPAYHRSGTPVCPCDGCGPACPGYEPGPDG
jgi:hypothetical protein